MPATYLLPCHGDNVVEITTADAGRTVACPCGEQVLVPTLREIRRLPQKQTSEESTAARGAGWSLQQGIMFSIGLALVAVAVAAVAWLGYERTKLDTKEIVVSQEHLDAWDEQVMNMDAAVSLDFWNQVLSKPLPEERQAPQFEKNRAAARVIYIKMGIAGGVAILGLGLIGASVLLKPQPTKRRKSPRKKPAPA